MGLAHLEHERECGTVVVMDSDGEDDPADVPRLLAACSAARGRNIIFAERTRRSESRLFRFCYSLYRIANRLLTGRSIRFGNFSAIPRPALESLAVVSELWNHYPAAVIKSRLPYQLVPTRRAKRLYGESRMNFVGLVTHGLSALSVDSETIGVRLLLVSLVTIVLILAGLLATLAVRLTTHLAIPGWATTAGGVLLVLLLQAVMLTLVFSFLVLGGRTGHVLLAQPGLSLLRGGLPSVRSGRRRSREGRPGRSGPLRFVATRFSSRDRPDSRRPARGGQTVATPSQPPEFMSVYQYVGSELELFSAATRWKAYLRRWIAPYLGAEVLEVGAGLGGTTQVICDASRSRWTCLEPDAELAAHLTARVEEGALPGCCEVAIGTLDAVDGPYDAAVYIDVLEHIEDDRGELERAARLLKPGGHIVVLSPAHPFLYSPFDRAIGHYRRYTRESLKALAPSGLELARLIYLDSVGLLASLGNRLILRSEQPSPSQIALWDKFLVRASEVVDPLLGYNVGKSVLGVWRRPWAPQVSNW